MNRIGAVALATAISAYAGTARAELLTFNAALERAAMEAPSIKGRAAGVAAVRASSIAADRLPDPTLDVGIQDFPVTGPDAGQFNRDNFTMQKIGISQQFINPAKCHARAARASAEIGIAEADARAETRNVRLQTALAWVDLYYAERRLGQLTLLDASLGDLQATVTARLSSGLSAPTRQGRGAHPPLLQHRGHEPASCQYRPGRRARRARGAAHEPGGMALGRRKWAHEF